MEYFIDDDGKTLKGLFIKFKNKEYIVHYNFRRHHDETTYLIEDETDEYFFVKAILSQNKRRIPKKYVKIYSSMYPVHCPRCRKTMSWSITNNSFFPKTNMYYCQDCKLQYQDYILLNNGEYKRECKFQNKDVFLLEKSSHTNTFPLYKKYDGYALLERVFRKEEDALNYIREIISPRTRWMRIEI